MPFNQTFPQGFREIDGADLNAALSAPIWALSPGLTASALGTPIRETITVVSVPVAGYGVTLPRPLPGQLLLVRNASVLNMQVYAPDNCSINGFPGPTGYDQPPGSKVIYVGLSPTAWGMFSNPPAFGSFYSDQTQLNGGGNNVMTLNRLVDSAGFSVVGGSKVTAAAPGVYNIQFSAQIEKTDAGTDNMEIWLAKGGADVPASNTFLTLQGNNAKAVAAWNFMIPLDTGEFFELKWYSADTNIFLPAIAATTRPAVPSVILTVQGV